MQRSSRSCWASGIVPLLLDADLAVPEELAVEATDRAQSLGQGLVPCPCGALVLAGIAALRVDLEVQDIAVALEETAQFAFRLVERQTGKEDRSPVVDGTKWQ
jgi:hypothetical protein